MRKYNRLLISVLILGLMLTAVHIISAQQRDQQQQRGQQQRREMMDPQQMMERMMGRALEGLELSAEETDILKPKVEVILQTRLAQGTEMREMTGALREAVDSGDSGKITEALTKLKNKQKEHKAKSASLELGLTELLTVKQEAQLTLAGVVNAGGSGLRVGGFAGGGGQRGGAGAGRQGRQRRPGG